MLRKQLFAYGGIVLAVIALAIIVKPIVRIWIGSNFEVPLTLVISMSMYVLVSTWVNIFAYFLNGVQKIRLSLNISLFAMLFNIPVSIALAKYSSLGVSSIIFGTICALLPGVFFGPLQTIKIINKRDVGVWAK
jgi:O-antigen/teichoic acid export membrane protein